MAWEGLSGAAVSSLLVWPSHEASEIPDASTWIFLLGYGIVCSGVGWSLISKDLPRMEASAAGIALILQSMAAFIWDVLLLSRPTTAVKALSAVFTLNAVYLGAVHPAW